MKLREVQSETMIFELRREIGEVLSESITEYLATMIAHLKSKKQHDLFNTEAPLVNLDQLAAIIAGLKILSDYDQRSILSREEIRINPNSSQALFNLLDSIPKTGKGIPKLTQDVFQALKKVSPKSFQAEKDALKILKTNKESERQRVISDLEKLSGKVTTMFNKVRSLAHGGE